MKRTSGVCFRNHHTLCRHVISACKRSMKWKNVHEKMSRTAISRLLATQQSHMHCKCTVLCCVVFGTMMATHSSTTLHSCANTHFNGIFCFAWQKWKYYLNFAMGNLELRINFKNVHYSHLMTKSRQSLLGIHFVNFVFNCDKLICEKLVWPLTALSL